MLQKKSDEFEQLYEKYDKLKMKVKELSQENQIYSHMCKKIETNSKDLKKSQSNLKKQLDQKLHSQLESEQEKLLLEKQLERSESSSKKSQKKYYVALVMAALSIAIISGAYSIMFAELAGQQYKIEVTPKPTGYTIQNLRGDTINTFLSWRLVPGDTLRVNIINSDNYDPEKIEVIKKTILSEKQLEIDNSLMHKGPKGTTSILYEGWLGALNDASKTDTNLFVPTNIEVIESNNGEGDITIELTNRKNADGFAGWTNSIADDSQNQILKSRITIFAVDSLSLAELETIVRHEMGHALGLAHSTDPEDLMYPTIQTNFPYISECDVDAIESLYDGQNTSEVICEI
ncbi:matrix metalloproteinase-1 interstitial collagenase [Marine Group I thaumarchaeote SCGC AAA799-P11]|uniref:Matrix metalloproteinase-1 interstitial collagenase n=1 Tax=Marine Group I thaumarchaeote SCGC AAA799-P11 TaxID=1502295 RepID=A0A087RZB5_9ARCH|nr:matrix metalloproteinase-1 interstitial collagenase [Marine Group I thaumarchaeote SCGC AAA799-P11]